MISNRRLKKILSITIPLLIGGLFIIFAYNKFTTQQIQEIGSYLKNADYLYIYISILFSFIASFLRSYRWKYPLEHLGYKVSLKNRFLAVNVSYLMNMFIPRSGEVSRSLVLKNYDNVPFDKSFGTIIAERIVDLFCLGILMCLVFFMQFDIVKKFILDYIPKDKIILFAIVAFAVFICVFLIYKYSKWRFISFLKFKLSGFREGISSLIQMKKKWRFIFQTILIWIFFLLMFWIAVFAFPETATLNAEAIITTFVVGSIAIAFTNNGLGSYPFLVAEILLFYNITLTVGSAFGWIVWITQTLFTISLGLISLLILPLVNKNTQH
ncbi:MAG: lysylphosphatidylglycerol synthase transmembrane domain-containing protein [Bacteroidota bacterium]|nr:lysylphosphatidylglycerol synthase transmembrane domain-containing protein [Bacteroidota bacterium]